MIILSHQGAAGLATENTLTAVKAGLEADADIIHVDVRLTQDSVPVLVHDASLTRTHRIKQGVESLTYRRLQELTRHHCPPRLSSLLDAYFGKILLNLELRSRGSGKIVAELIRQKAGTSQTKWDGVLLSSFRVTELFAARRVSRHANIGLLQGNNPFAYIASQRFLGYTAIGFHRLHTSQLALAIAKKTGIFTYAYTVDRPQAAELLAEAGIDGIMTNYPDKLSAWLNSNSRKQSKR